MLLTLSWKNIWRNKKRSTIIVLAIALGLWGGLFSGSVLMGMAESSVNSSIDRDLAHIQIHHNDYIKDKRIKDYIPNTKDILTVLNKNSKIENTSARTIIYGMAQSPASSFGVKLIAIDPEQEQKITTLNQNLIEGDYFGKKYKNQVIIGQKLAKRLNLKLRSKVILNFQNLEGDISYMACRVVGIFKTTSTIFDAGTIIMRQSDAFRVLETKAVYHEIAVRLKSSKELLPVLNELKANINGVSIESWKEIAPEVAYLSDIMASFSYLFVSIILFALLFGITNTMLMSVMERIRELGVLLAVGMKKGRVFMMIILETIFLSLSGGFVGVVFSLITIHYFGFAGIDLSTFSSSLGSFGVATMLHPYLPLEMYLSLPIMIIIAALLASILPAMKATKLKPAEAVRVY
jgi:ABC-type lipoprotein release transport system permease subunit